MANKRNNPQVGPLFIEDTQGQKGKGKVQNYTKTYGDSSDFVKSGDGDGVGSKSKFGSI